MLSDPGSVWAGPDVLVADGPSSLPAHGHLKPAVAIAASSPTSYPMTAADAEPFIADRHLTVILGVAIEPPVIRIGTG